MGDSMNKSGYALRTELLGMAIGILESRNARQEQNEHFQAENDKRYQATMDTPENLLQQDYTSDFSIKDGFLPGVASYLDNQATTPMDPRVLDAMMPMYMQRFGNPHSRTRK